MSQSQPGRSQALEGLRDEELIALVALGNEAALGALYDRYSRLVYTIALRVTGDRQTAEEVMQDVFQNIWQTARGFVAGRGAAAAWITGVSRHRAIDAIRSKRERARAREQTLLIGEGLPEPSGGEDPEIETLDVREAVRSALDSLPSSQRQAIELAYYGGLTRAEIAERLGEPLGTIKTRLRLGLTRLRDALSQFAE